MRARVGFGAVLLVVLGALVVWGGDGQQVDPGVRVCDYVNAGVIEDDPASVGRLAADSSVPAIAAAGVRLRDATTDAGAGVAAGQLAAACRARQDGM